MAIAVAESIATTVGFNALIADKNGVFYKTVNGSAYLLSFPTSTISQLFNREKWQEILFDIIASAFQDGLMDGFANYIIGEVSEVVSQEIDKAMEPKKTVESVMAVPSMSNDCWSAIKADALQFEKVSIEMCHSLQEAINNAVSLSQGLQNEDINNPLIAAWAAANPASHCPTDLDDEAYRNLLVDIGCDPKLKSSDPSTELHPDTALVTDYWWSAVGTWEEELQCPDHSVLTGFCASGGNDCYGATKQGLCARAPWGSTIKPYGYSLGRDYTRDLAFCQTGYAAKSFCSYGIHRDCLGSNLRMACFQLDDRYVIDYGSCNTKESKVYGEHLQATSPNEIIVGMCSSGGNPNCGGDGTSTQAAMFCPIVMRKAGEEDLVPLLRLSNGSDNMIVGNLAENPGGYAFIESTIRLSTKGGNGKRPIYRCRSIWDHFETNDPNCEGQTKEGLHGYASTVDNGKPIHRCISGGGDHFLTTSWSECTGGGSRHEADLGFSY